MAKTRKSIKSIKIMTKQEYEAAANEAEKPSDKAVGRLKGSKATQSRIIPLTAKTVDGKPLSDKQVKGLFNEFNPKPRKAKK